MADDTLTITISGQANVAWLREQVRSGLFDNEAEAVSHVVREARASDSPVELWLRDEILARIEEYEAEPSMGIPIEEVMRNLEKRHKTAESSL